MGAVAGGGSRWLERPRQGTGAGVAMGGGTETNTGEQLALPQDYADMLGWPEQAAAVAAAFRALPPAEQGVAAVLGGNYGQAGALALYGPRLGLPPAVSPAGSFWFFGPGDREGRVAVVVADSAAAAPTLARLYAEVRPVAPAAPASWSPRARPATRPRPPARPPAPTCRARSATGRSPRRTATPAAGAAH